MEKENREEEEEEERDTNETGGVALQELLDETEYHTESIPRLTSGEGGYNT